MKNKFDSTNKMQIWTHINRPDLGLMNAISQLVHQLELQQPNLLTTLRLGPTLVLTCDFSGQHKSSEFESYSFLLADLAYLWLWDEMRKEARSKHLPDGRRISFKRLNDQRRQDILVDFLRAANCIPGLLFSVLIDKSIPSLFMKEGKLDLSQPGYCGYEHWKPSSFEKLMRVAHFVALLIACMSAPRQNVILFSDEDEIAPNDKRIKEACEIIAHHCNHYLPHGLGHFRFGTTKSDDGSRMIEDLSSIPDLAAGAFCELAPLLHKSETNLDTSSMFTEGCLQSKTHLIMDWLTESTHTLKRLLVRIENDKAGKIRTKCTNFYHVTDLVHFHGTGI